jgi:hypothetical protein
LARWANVEQSNIDGMHRASGHQKRRRAFMPHICGTLSY